MLNYVEYPSSVKEGTETPGAFDQNGQRFYVLDRLQEQVSRIRYLLDTLAVRQTKESVSVVVWYPRLRADLSLYKTPYPDFPIPRLVFGFSVGAADGAVSACRIGVIADETPTPDTTRIAPGVLLSDAQITTQNKGGVVLYILESYQIVGSPEENAA